MNKHVNDSDPSTFSLMKEGFRDKVNSLRQSSYNANKNLYISLGFRVWGSVYRQTMAGPDQ